MQSVVSVIPSRVKKDLEKADKMYKQKRFAEALAIYTDCPPWSFPQLGFFYMRGIGCRKNLSLAIKYFKLTLDKLRAYKEEAYSSLVNLGVIYTQMKKFDEALFYHMEALKIRKHDADIINNIGYIYRCKGNIKMAIKNYEKAAGFGEAYSKYFLAKLYQDGIYGLFDKDKPKSVQWYKKLFTESTPKQLFQIAKNFHFGFDCFKENLKESRVFYEKAMINAKRRLIATVKTKKKKKKKKKKSSRALGSAKKLKKLIIKSKNRVFTLIIRIGVNYLKRNMLQDLVQFKLTNCSIVCMYHSKNCK